MDGKYIIILLFIFLVFLMGSINSTVTNNFYNNTTGSQDHAVLSNLSYADSNHTGFQSSDTLDDDVSALGYVTNESMTPKLNLTGGTITGQNSSSVTDVFFKMQNINNSFANTTYDNRGIQVWNLSATGLSPSGSIWYGTPGGAPGIDFYNSTMLGRVGMRYLAGANASLRIFAQSNIVTIGYPDTTFLAGVNVTFTNLAGSGNAYDCLDSTGKHYRGNPVCT